MASNPAGTRIPEVSEYDSFDKVEQSFQDYGFLYQTFPGIGDIVESLSSEEGENTETFNKRFQDILFKNEYIREILQPYSQQPPSFAFPLGFDPIHYYVLAKDPKIGQDRGHPISVYVWRKHTHLDCALGSLKGEFVTSGPRPNRMFLVPYPQIEGVFNEAQIKMEEGGILIAHPRHAFIVKKGFAFNYTWLGISTDQS